MLCGTAARLVPPKYRYRTGPRDPWEMVGRASGNLAGMLVAGAAVVGIAGAVVAAVVVAAAADTGRAGERGVAGGGGGAAELAAVVGIGAGAGAGAVAAVAGGAVAAGCHRGSCRSRASCSGCTGVIGGAGGAASRGIRKGRAGPTPGHLPKDERTGWTGCSRSEAGPSAGGP